MGASISDLDENDKQAVIDWAGDYWNDDCDQLYDLARSGGERNLKICLVFVNQECKGLIKEQFSARRRKSKIPALRRAQIKVSRHIRKVLQEERVSAAERGPPSDKPGGADEDRELAVADQERRWASGEYMVHNCGWVKHLRPTSMDEAIEQCLQRHNTLRRWHAAPPLRWSNELAEGAKAACIACLQKGQLHHSNYGSREGQSGWMGPLTSGPLSSDGGAWGPVCFADAIDMWYAEINDYDFNSSRAQHRGVVGHFTAVVAMDTQHVGMAKVSGKVNGTDTCFIFANYSPGQANTVANPITSVGRAELVEEMASCPDRPQQLQQRVRHAFAALDLSHDGIIQDHELREALQGIGVAEERAAEIIEAADTNRNGEIDLDEFMNWVFAGQNGAGRIMARLV
eukprot:TRINITY_DN33115_c0_g1_i2.p1 TRINITY_DN33115_c0_g1~~TRINITY_DN33115_c0_g1_i2.p1  ORF type:complete len:400 (-),score=71.50 TRINITY_DN33115_c0_g1_i2:118-1317(-)